MLISLQELYQTLLRAHGPQGWWPLISFAGTNPTLRGRLTGYHPKNFDLPETEEEMLEIIVGAILTQNTSWLNAEKALFELHQADLLNLSALKRRQPADLAPLIRSSGYYNQKAARLADLAGYLTTHPISTLMRRTLEDLRPELRAVKGVGDETCDSILLYALKKPIFVVDAYTKRLLGRLGLLAPAAKYAEVQALFHGQVPPSVPVYNEYHALIVFHCVYYCKKVPLCEGCILEVVCPKNIEERPKRPRRQKKKGK